MVVGLHEELVGEVGLVGVDDDRLGEVLQDLDDRVVVLAIAALLTSCVNIIYGWPLKQSVYYRTVVDHDVGSSSGVQ